MEADDYWFSQQSSSADRHAVMRYIFRQVSRQQFILVRMTVPSPNSFCFGRFGRRCMLLAILAISGVFGIARSVAPTYYTFLTFEFLDPLFASGMYSACFILGKCLYARRFADTNYD